MAVLHRFYCISLFLQLLGKETEKFGGDTLLNGQEQLHQIKQQMDGWTDSALRVFSRHRGLEGRQHPDQVAMVKLNEVRPSIRKYGIYQFCYTHSLLTPLSKTFDFTISIKISYALICWLKYESHRC